MKPTLREKKRYIVFRTDMDMDSARQEIRQRVLDYIGILGSARAGVQFLDECWDSTRGMGVIRCNNKYASEVKASLLFSRNRFETPFTTGIIKKAKTFIKNCASDRL